MKVPPKRKGNYTESGRYVLETGEASMKVPPKRKGNPSAHSQAPRSRARLNESPSEKEGKSPNAYMTGYELICLNESPSEKEGKCLRSRPEPLPKFASMKVPPKRKGNAGPVVEAAAINVASMKVPPKRKGNTKRRSPPKHQLRSLNESPSEKEGKSETLDSF